MTPTQIRETEGQEAAKNLAKEKAEYEARKRAREERDG
jgi:hypothetical protein